MTLRLNREMRESSSVVILTLTDMPSNISSLISNSGNSYKSQQGQIITNVIILNIIIIL